MSLIRLSIGAPVPLILLPLEVGTLLDCIDALLRDPFQVFLTGTTRLNSAYLFPMCPDKAHELRGLINSGHSGSFTTLPTVRCTSAIDFLKQIL